MVEDERRVAGFIRRALAEEGFAVDLCGDGNEALDLIQFTSFDAIVLDVMLPGRDGLSVLKKLRSRSISTPVLILTARGSVNADRARFGQRANKLVSGFSWDRADYYGSCGTAN